MSLDKAEIGRLAQLAQLRVRPDEAEILAEELGKILGFVEQMGDAKLDDVTPMANPFDLSARLRPDLVTEVDRREHYQAQAPQVSDGLYLVPKVLD